MRPPRKSLGPWYHLRRQEDAWGMMGVGLLTNAGEQGTSLVAQWFRLQASIAGAWVPSLTGDPGSHKLHSMEKKRKVVSRRFVIEFDWVKQY